MSANVDKVEVAEKTRISKELGWEDRRGGSVRGASREA